MNALFLGIWNKYDGDDTLKASLTGGLWNTRVRQGKDMPYANFTMMSDIPNNTFTEDIEEYVFQFNIFYKEVDEVVAVTAITTIYENLVALYDDCELTVEGYTFIAMTREFSTYFYTGNDVWQYNIRYRIELQKN